MMSGTLAALVPGSSHSHSNPHTLNPTLLAHCERLIVRLQDPYFRAMLTHLTLSPSSGAWSDILDDAEDVLPFQERLAIAFAFLDDTALSSYLSRNAQKGNLDALMITGLSCASSKTLDLLQKYVDRTGDVQSAAILCSLCPPVSTKPTLSGPGDRRRERWVEMYRELLDGWKMHHWRVGFDIERGRILMEAGNSETIMGEWVPKQVAIRCNYCNKPVGGGEKKRVRAPFTKIPEADAMETVAHRLLPLQPCTSKVFGVFDDAHDSAGCRAGSRASIFALSR